MPEYRVEWDIELSARSPEAAAREALRIHRDPTSLATVFTVTNSRGEQRKIDLTEIDDNRGAEKRRRHVRDHGIRRKPKAAQRGRA